MRPLRGIAFKLASVMVFIVMASLIKSTADHVPAGQTVFFRSFFAIPVIFAWLAFRRELPGGLRTRNPFGHFWRGLMGTLAMASASRASATCRCRKSPPSAMPRRS